MKRNLKHVAAALMAACMLTGGMSVHAAEEVLPSGVAASEIGGEIERYVEENADTTAGMAVSVFTTEDTLYENYFGFADVENGVAVDEDTVFEWGSATKLFVWVSVMQLYEQGLIDLEEDVRNYLPDDFLRNLNYDTPVTMRHLMNHTAGFQEQYADLFIKETDADIPAMKSLEAALKAHEPEQIFEPGVYTAYSNWGVSLAAYIVEQISGQEFDAYVHEHIFEPLGMGQSAVAADLSDNEYVAAKRRELQCYTTERELIPDCNYHITLYPSGMCTSTLADFEKFGKALLDKESPLFRLEDTWKEMFSVTNHLGDTDIPVNYHGFWMIPFAVQTVGHGGNTAGCSSYLLISLEENLGVVVMTNQCAEKVYNEQMMELVFGKFEESLYFDSPRQMPDGMYRGARTVRKGPFKLISLTFLSEEWYADECWDYVNAGGIEKICYPYADYYRVSMAEFIGEIALVILWVAALAFSVISLLVKLIRLIVCKVKKKKMQVALGKWSGFAALLQVISLVLLIACVGSATSYAIASSYQWMVVAFAFLGVGMMVMAAYGVTRMIRRKNGKVQKEGADVFVSENVGAQSPAKSSRIRTVYNAATVVFLLGAVANIAYWNLFMFWEL